MTKLSQQIRELAGKAHNDCPNALYLPLPIKHLPTILAALELQERLEDPRMVERVARVICDAEGYDPDEDIIGGQATGFENFGARWQANHRSGGQLGVTDYVDLAQAAIASMKTPA